MSESIINALLGGSIIGVSVSLMLILNGRVTGIAGIYSQWLQWPKGDTFWRFAFILGLVLGGYVASLFIPNTFGPMVTDLPWVMIAGLLVGFGTALGSGCTSGHGVCGLSRFSIRSLVATLSFMGSGFLVASLIQLVKGV
ncbi:MAG TPA: YeeE/YedE thiosulfate transporter family protein [Pseudobdellovibrionaceae bacterium]|nr:YeeE/YedE thiosulfate transporter family protein [Pseudobdellovibrionaceae bacterium]